MSNDIKKTTDVPTVGPSIAVEPEKVPTTEVLLQGLDSMITPSISPIEDLKQIVSKDGVITMVTDQFLLLNAERLRNVLGEDTYRAYVASLSASPASPLSQLRAKLSDDDLLDSVKDRYIQHPSEVKSYIQGLDARLQTLKESIERQISEQRQGSVPPESSDGAVVAPASPTPVS